MVYKTLISASDLSSLIRGGNPAVIDCRFYLDQPEKGAEDYIISHIPGAFYAHLDRDLSGPIVKGETGRHPLPHLEDFALTLAQWKIEPGRQVIVYDQGPGGIAARLWWMLNWVGHPEVAVLDGGWAGWTRAGYPSDNKIPALGSGRYPVDPDPRYILETGAVLEWADTPGRVLVDSREAVRYKGLDEPIDPVAGHIPGAINLPFRENNAEDGTWRTRAELARRFEAIDTKDASDVAFYCGSGVTACHNILAMAHAGLGMPLLYPGSWSEWITDESRPISSDLDEGS